MPCPSSPSPSPDAKRSWLAILIGLAGLAGGHKLQRLLNAIPDSNDDFIFF
jgi:hypothetical protein